MRPLNLLQPLVHWLNPTSRRASKMHGGYPNPKESVNMVHLKIIFSMRDPQTSILPFKGWKLQIGICCNIVYSSAKTSSIWILEHYNYQVMYFESGVRAYFLSYRTGSEPRHRSCVPTAEQKQSSRVNRLQSPQYPNLLE